MATFLGVVGKQASFAKEVLVGADGYGLLLNTGKGKVLAVWSDKEPVKMSDLKKFSNQNSVLRDWEGKKMALSATDALGINRVYYISAPDDAALAKAESVDRLVPAARIQRGSMDAPTANFIASQILDGTAPKDGPWIANDWKYVPLKGQAAGNSTLSARALVGVHPDGIDVIVEAHDVKHVQEQADSWWLADSLQLAIDCEGRGMIGGNMEIVAALKPDGVVFRKLAVANAGADLPAGITGANEAMRQGDCKISREGETTTYRIHLPWSELYPMAYDPKRNIKMSLLLNNNDGEGRSEYLEWGGGIAGNAAAEKDPAHYGTLKPAETK
jgi:hypothetical protein